MEAEGQQPFYYVMKLERTQPEFSPLTSASQLSAEPKSNQASLHLLPRRRGRNVRSMVLRAGAVETEHLHPQLSPP